MDLRAQLPKPVASEEQSEIHNRLESAPYPLRPDATLEKLVRRSFGSRPRLERRLVSWLATTYLPATRRFCLERGWTDATDLHDCRAMIEHFWLLIDRQFASEMITTTLRIPCQVGAILPYRYSPQSVQ
jgi:hypothetical protein